MKQRAMISFFTLKGLKTRAIHTELESVYGPEALALLIVKKWRRRFHQGRTDIFDDSRCGKSLTNDLVGAVGSVLKEEPLNSCKVLCHDFRIGMATCLPILQDKLGLQKFHLRWVLCALSINQKNEIMSYSKLFSV
jgi:hypothetical protein